MKRTEENKMERPIYKSIDDLPNHALLIHNETMKMFEYMGLDNEQKKGMSDTFLSCYNNPNIPRKEANE